MGILRYVVQGFGWEVGRKAAEESMEAVAEAAKQAERDKQVELARARAAAPTRRELAKLEKAKRKEEARRTAEIEAQLRRMKNEKKQNP